MKGSSLAPASVNSQVPGGQTQDSALWLEEGSQLMGFGFYPGFTYREAWNWICAGTISVNDLLHGNNILGAKVMSFLSWMQKMQHVV